MSLLSQECLKMDHPLCFLLMTVFSGCVLLSSPAIAASCPYNVQACTCTGNTLLCTNLDGLPSLVSNNQDGSITNLTFQSGKLNSIYADSLPANLQTISFSNVSFTSVSPEAFSGSSTTLKSVSMSKVTYSDLPEALLKVNNLTELKLSDVNITNWRPEVVQYLGKTLRSVAFVNVGLTSWPEWLKDFTSLNSLDLSYNPVHNISIDTFTNVRNLTRLTLRSSLLGDEKNLNDALTPTQNTLEYLNINSNGFTEIPSCLLNMPRLSTLIISWNLIDEITSNRIPPQLQRLDLSANRFSQLSDTSFPQSTALEMLLVEEYLLYYISDLALEPLQQLKVLDLHVSNLAAIPLAITQLPNLILLDIGYGMTCECPRDVRFVRWYQSLKNLTIRGVCNTDKGRVLPASYLGDDNWPCSGNHVKGSLFLYLLLGILMTVYLW